MQEIKIALSIILKELYNMSNVLELTIPASTANLGVGFDSIGMAFFDASSWKIYSHFIPDVSFTDRCKNLSKAIPIESKLKWEYIFHDDASKQLPTDETNFIYHVAQQVAAKSIASMHHHGKYIPILSLMFPLQTDAKIYLKPYL
jgi:homoserine kinase